jgi:hypothetical protein
MPGNTKLAVATVFSLSLPRRSAKNLFYRPLVISRDSRTGNYDLTFQNQLYANKRAVDFILQELSERQQRQWLSPIAERITYLTADQSIVGAISRNIAIFREDRARPDSSTIFGCPADRFTNS